MSEKILVIRFGSIGDLILTTPTLQNLRLNYPASEIVFLTKEEYAPIVELFGTVDRIVSLPKSASAVDYYNLLQKLDRESFDIVIDLHRKTRSWLARKIITANKTIVYPKRRIERRQAIRRLGKKITAAYPHTIELYNDTVKQLGGRILCHRPQLGSQLLLERYLSDSVSGRKKIKKIFIAPGAAHPTKSWGGERFVELAERLMNEYSCQISWAVTEADRPDPDQLKRLEGEAFSLYVNEPFESLLSIVAACDLAITNDSGLMHLASAAGTPVLALFGPTHPVLGFAPKGLFDRIIQTDESCRPCSLHGKNQCYREKQFCFELITPEAVIGNVLKLLDKTDQLTPALFVDRDGTLIVEKNFLSDPDQVELIPGVAQALKLASERGYRIVMVSNQSGVARGYFGTDKVELVNARVTELLAAEGAELDGAYYCPYHIDGTVPEYAKLSELRKPRAGMPEQAAVDLKLDLRRSIVIGDKLDDFLLGRVIGGRSAIVRTGYGQAEAAKGTAYGLIDNKNLFDDLLSAVQSMT